MANGGQSVTNDQLVILDLTGFSDTGSGLYAMRFSNDATNWSDWQSVANYVSWDIGTGWGAHNIHVELRDRTGNVVAADTSIELRSTAMTFSVHVGTTIEISGLPALITLGQGVPGDELTSQYFHPNIKTNNASGYEFRATISDLAGSGNDTVPASAMSLNGLAALDANTPIVLHDTAVPTDSDGDTLDMSLMLNLPFVSTGTYGGQIFFLAANNQ